ncbi:uncharacterized protein ankdd1b [Genypterus blacodes]|uniref:uncharacterized protein ankdd1b n=1 Tax=Genypterus blacodes TaxID=154954 RepID=UPI003F773235
MERPPSGWKAKMTKENLDPRKWIKPEMMKGFNDFLNKNSDKEADLSFDNTEMLLENEKKFLDAAKTNDIETMRTVGRGVSANAKNVQNRTALHYAAAGANVEAVKLLLQRRAQVDQKDKFGVLPIHLAAWFGSLEIVKLLVGAGAEQKSVNDEGLNIMHCAAMNNHSDILEYIVNDLQMKELDKVDKSGHRPFALAAENGSNDMLDLLMRPEYDMGTMAPDKSGDTPLHLAAKNGHEDTINLLLQSFDTRDDVNMAGETALYKAADCAFEECVQIMLERGCDPNVLTANKCSALHPVAERGDTSLVKLLLEYRAQKEFQNERLETPLHLAVRNSHIPVIHCLVEAGCNVNVTDQRSQTAMHMAAELSKVDVVEMLLKAEVDLTIQDKQGKTALAVAARANEAIVVDMIIKAERYFIWKKSNHELNESLQSEFPLTFKLDHRYETKQVRAMAWRLSYQLLKQGDWKKLAGRWHFTKDQVLAIEEQYTGQQSYKEHGNRMLLIWLHGEEFARRNPAKELFHALLVTGNRRAADSIRMEEGSGSSKNCSIS